MRRYEIWLLKSAVKNGQLDQSLPEFVMILQSEKLDHLNSIIVAPL
jgi:hypothetical protein